MADRQGRRVVKRLHSCKIRVKTKSTTGKKFSRAIPPLANRYSRLSDNTPGTNVNTEPDVFSSEDFNDNVDTFDKTHKATYPFLSKHHQRRIKENNSWNAIRQSLLEARLEEEAFDSDTERCVACQKNHACCRCLECGPRQYFCLDCAKSTHEYRNYFHQLEIFKDSCFVSLMMNHSVLSLPHQKNCPCAEGRLVMCIDQNGY
ncbi:uncharacterized protein LOC114539593 [Dendronephthya gigantea]|uniref:uncharacterized protein LOC114539593 n=1 Tax=Dendronephthya gigantea TaxID=151771 RepID=UPI00106991FC|nr:uncharacterized protein LOC114539593 [Dendronephthya gigantea]